MQAIILAAGMGKRLGNLTANNTKCMVKINGVTLIERMLKQLDKHYLSRIIIVVGYQANKLMEHIKLLDIATPIEFINNPIYDKTNNIYSLSLARDYLIQEDTLLLESDLIFDYDILKMLINDKRDTLVLVDKYESWMDGTVIKIKDDDSIQEFIPGNKFDFNDAINYYKTVNIYKFSQNFSVTHYVPFLNAYLQALGNNEYYEQVLHVITILDIPIIRAKKLNGQLWYEIDDIQDLDIASSMFTLEDNKKLELLQSRYGGYWRYPKLLDFCYLVNPYYPPIKLMDEIMFNFEKLLCQYPSGMAVNSLLAAKNFGVNQKHILVGNGAAELIKILINGLEGNVGFIHPTFEEYPNRYIKNASIVFNPKNENFAYSSPDIIDFFDDKEIKTIVIVNPDNPSGNYIYKKDLLKLLDWTLLKRIDIIIDESFVDFADEPNSTLISEEIICKYKNLIIIKSISKSYGIPGLRLGVLVAYDEQLIETFKKDAAIWNINSFGEFYMQIQQKYLKDYETSLIKIREGRKKYISDLQTIYNLRILPSQANYIMLEILGGIKSKDLTQILLVKYNLFIKDLSSKIKFNDRQFIRIAIRTEYENTRLIKALKETLNESKF